MERPSQEFLEFARQAFQSTLDAATKVQQHTQKLMEELMRQGTAAQVEGKRHVSDWVEQSRRQMEEFQRTAAEGYRKWEEEVSRRLTPLTPATKQEVGELRQRVEELARRVQELERR